MPEGQEFSFLCSCSGCRDSFELTGIRTNGTIMLDKDPRVVGICDGTLYDRCGGRIRIFGFDKIFDQGVKLDYPVKKRGRIRRKMSPVF